MKSLESPIPVRRRRGPASKILRLPPELRAVIDQMIDDNKSYTSICTEMAAHGIKLNKVNVHKYYTQQYQDSVVAVERVATLSRLHEDIRALSEDERTDFHAAALEVGMVHTFKALQTNHPSDDPQDSIRLFNAVARLSREALLLRKHRDHLKLLAPKTPDRNLVTK